MTVSNYTLQASAQDKSEERWHHVQTPPNTCAAVQARAKDKRGAVTPPSNTAQHVRRGSCCTQMHKRTSAQAHKLLRTSAHAARAVGASLVMKDER